MSVTRWYILFRSSFRYEAALNISHETLDKKRTLCGRKVDDAATLEDDNNNLEPDCISCRRTLDRLRSAQVVEAQIKCEACSPGHRLGALRKPCGVHGCECWCNR